MLPTRQTTTALALAAVFLCLSCCLDTTEAQQNAQLQIPPALVGCYNTSYYMNRDNRLPSNIESLITLIEKVENSNEYFMDIRSLSVALIQLFRQDGIQRSPVNNNLPGVLPYSPTGFQFPKFRILVQRLIPGNAMNFPNSSLTNEEFCSMHFMLSSSFDLAVRGDENQVCNKLSHYRAQRLPRVARSADDAHYKEQVEMLENVNPKLKPRGIAAAQAGKQMRDFEINWSEIDYGYTGGSSNSGNDNSVSQCPVENGVIWTPWGSVTAGSVIAGIAAGLQQQTVQVRALLALSNRPGSNSPQTTTLSIDNRWAATLSGDLAEVALVQVPLSSNGNASVGANGAWNDTVMAKWYFLSQRRNLEMTDAEIRGDLDGLILAMNVASWYTQVPSLKLSQLLRMYYSPNGVLGSGIRACDRQQNFPIYAPLNTMISQTTAFSQVLDREMRLTVTLSQANYAQFSTLASRSLLSYVPQYVNDLSCSVINGKPTSVSEYIVPMTNIMVYLDTSWQYKNIVDYVTYILQRLNINPYASSITMLSAADCSIIVNYTNYMSDVYEKWNVTTQALYTPGFNLPNILQSVQNLTQLYMNVQQANTSVGGNSLVALIIPNTAASVSESDTNFATTQLQNMQEQMPDLNFVYYAGGTISRFAAFVDDPSQDLFALSLGSNVAASAGPVVMRIVKFPRQIINPNCGANWYTNSWGTNQMYQYISPNSTNFYGVAPNYFFGSTSGRYVNIQSQNSLPVLVCSSRSTVLPTQNYTASSTSECVVVNSNTYSYDLSNACNGYSTIHQCPPLYLSVQYSNTTATVSCTDAACQSPDQIKITISVVNLGCFSGVAHLAASFATILLAYFLRSLLQ